MVFTKLIPVETNHRSRWVVPKIYTLNEKTFKKSDWNIALDYAQLGCALINKRVNDVQYVPYLSDSNFVYDSQVNGQSKRIFNIDFKEIPESTYFWISAQTMIHGQLYKIVPRSGKIQKHFFNGKKTHISKLKHLMRPGISWESDQSFITAFDDSFNKTLERYEQELRKRSQYVVCRHIEMYGENKYPYAFSGLFDTVEDAVAALTEYIEKGFAVPHGGTYLVKKYYLAEGDNPFEYKLEVPSTEIETKPLNGMYEHFNQTSISFGSSTKTIDYSHWMRNYIEDIMENNDDPIGN